MVLALVLTASLTACGRDRPAAATAEETTDTGAFPEEDLSGTVRADGSSTVAPLVSLAAERFRKEEPGVKVTVGISGTGGGFERFCRGETDLSNASRPIKDEEIAACKKKGIEYLELQVANDGLSVVVNNGNDWAKCLTVEQLKKIWQPGSKIKNWKDVDPSFPSQSLTLFGPGPTPAPSTTSPTRSSARKGRAARTTRRPRTTTSSCAASPARRARWATSGSPTSRATRAS